MNGVDPAVSIWSRAAVIRSSVTDGTKHLSCGFWKIKQTKKHLIVSLSDNTHVING